MKKKIIGIAIGVAIGIILAFSLGFTGAYEAVFWSINSADALQPLRNIALNGNWLSGDGDDEGVAVNSDGVVSANSNNSTIVSFKHGGVEVSSINQYGVALFQGSFVSVGNVNGNPGITTYANNFRISPDNNANKGIYMDSVTDLTTAQGVFSVDNIDSSNHDIWVGGGEGTVPWSYYDRGDVGWTISSSRDNKENIKPILTIADFDLLVPSTFNYKKESAGWKQIDPNLPDSVKAGLEEINRRAERVTQKKRAGLIADDWHAALERPDTGFIDTGEVQAHLVLKIKQLEQRVKALEEK